MAQAHTQIGYIARLAEQSGSPSSEAFLKSGVRFSLDAGETAFYEASGDARLIDVMSGWFRLERAARDGGRQVFSFVPAGHFVGVMSGARAHYSAVAATPVEAVGYSPQALNAMLREGGEFALRYVEALQKIIRSSQDLVVVLGRRSAVERVAAFILYIRDIEAQASGREPPADALVQLPATRADIADFMGLTIESVSRAFSELKARGWVALPGPREAQIQRLSALRNFVDTQDFATAADAPDTPD